MWKGADTPGTGATWTSYHHSTAILAAMLTRVNRCDRRCLPGRDGERRPFHKSVSVGKGSGDSKDLAKHEEDLFLFSLQNEVFGI